MNQGQNTLCSCTAQTVQRCDQGLQYCKNKSTLECFFQQAFSFAGRYCCRNEIKLGIPVTGKFILPIESFPPPNWESVLNSYLAMMPVLVTRQGVGWLGMVWGCSTGARKGFYCFQPHFRTWFWHSTLEAVESLIQFWYKWFTMSCNPVFEWALVCKGLLQFQFLSKTRKYWKY